jgi:hypothetical protein
MRHARLLSWVTALSLVGGVSVLSSCVVEERKFDKQLAEARNEDNETDEGDETSEAEPEAGAASEDSPECEKYCDRALANCKDDNAIYASRDTCLGICKLLPLEPEEDEVLSKSNTVACRSEQARLAGQTGEPEVHCAAAGPGGSPAGRSDGCGNNCESYCMLQPLLCAEEDDPSLEQLECESRCLALPDRGAFDVVADHDANNVQCRLVHLSSAALGPTAAEDHCWHSSITPREGSPCRTPDDATPDCKTYCEVVTRACTGELAVYAHEAECLAACPLFEPGKGADRTEDTLGCRLYHSYASLEAPDNHCPHASPSGDGHCGADNCVAYCSLAQAACSAAFASGPGSIEACLASCDELPGSAKDQGYAYATSESGDSVQCRIHHATLALEEPSECDAVFGGEPCSE